MSHRNGFYPLKQIEGQVQLLLCKRLLFFSLEWFRAKIMIITPPYICLCRLTKGEGGGGFTHDREKSLPEANAGAPFQNINKLAIPTWYIIFIKQRQDSAYVSCHTSCIQGIK